MKTAILVLLSFGLVQASALPQERYQALMRKISEQENSFATPDQLQQILTQLKAQAQIFKLSDQDQADLKAMTDYASQLDANGWQQLLAKATNIGQRLATVAASETLEEQSPALYDATQSLAPMPPAIAARASVQAQGQPGDFILSPLEDLIDPDLTPLSGASYSKQMSNPNAPFVTPILIGGGFPFNQTQFSDFNLGVMQITQTADFYDPICTGMAVLYDAVVNQSQICQPRTLLDLPQGQTNDPAVLLLDEVSVRYAYSQLGAYLRSNIDPFDSAAVTRAETAVFRVARLSYRGITLYDQARAMMSLVAARDYNQSPGVDRRGIVVGLSYGGLTVAKTAAMFPGRFKSIVLFSPGTENTAHVGTDAGFSADLEMTWSYRRILGDLVDGIAMSPHYSDYLPTVLAPEYDKPAFRYSLEKKMLGELDLDIASDLSRIEDRFFMVTGAKDVVIDPKTQIAAMRVVFQTHPDLGTFVLVPTAGHAQWGNPADQNLPAVLEVLTEVEKGDAAGALKPGNVYEYIDGSGFKLLGVGAAGLDQASAIVDPIQKQIKSAAPQ